MKTQLAYGIVSDSDIRSGRPILDGYGVMTGVVYERFMVGETIEALALDYDIPSEWIQGAIRWECRLKKKTTFEPGLTDD